MNTANKAKTSCCSADSQASHGKGAPVHAPHAHDHSTHGHGALSVQGVPPSAVRDPVCGMTVDPHTAKHRAGHLGQTYYFCSARCREKFVAAPEKYLAPAQAEAPPVPAGTIYTC